MLNLAKIYCIIKCEVLLIFGLLRVRRRSRSRIYFLLLASSKVCRNPVNVLSTSYITAVVLLERYKNYILQCFICNEVSLLEKSIATRVAPW